MKKWTRKTIDKSIVPKIANGCGVSTLTASVLAAKGYTSPEAVKEKLDVHELSSPFLIRDMEIAADIINEAIENGTSICVYGDNAFLHFHFLLVGYWLISFLPT